MQVWKVCVREHDAALRLNHDVGIHPGTSQNCGYGHCPNFRNAVIVTLSITYPLLAWKTPSAENADAAYQPPSFLWRIPFFSCYPSEDSRWFQASIPYSHVDIPPLACFFLLLRYSEEGPAYSRARDRRTRRARDGHTPRGGMGGDSTSPDTFPQCSNYPGRLPNNLLQRGPLISCD